KWENNVRRLWSRNLRCSRQICNESRRNDNRVLSGSNSSSDDVFITKHDDQDELDETDSIMCEENNDRDLDYNDQSNSSDQSIVDFNKFD
ncbi:unnamed protein product, partial [Brachionus calyciflorus]